LTVNVLFYAKQNYLEDMTTARDKKFSKDAVALVIAQ